MTTAEKLYSTREQEALAILFWIGKFDQYFRGRRFTVVTDHKSLSRLPEVPILKGRLLNWAFKLRSYDFDIIYRKGTENAMADLLSRLHLVDAQSRRLHCELDYERNPTKACTIRQNSHRGHTTI